MHLVVVLILSLFSFMSMAIVGGQIIGATDQIAKSTVALVAIRGNQVRPFCTGTLIGRRHVLTAAHCVQGGRSISILFGTGVNRRAKLISVIDSIPHLRFTPGRMRGGLKKLPNAPANDIAVLELSNNAPAGFMVAEIGYSGRLSKGDPLILAGFGQTRFSGGGSGLLRKVETIFKKYHPASFEFLFGHTPGKSACRGDSGGPAYFVNGKKLHVIGVTSRGGGCIGSGIYTDVESFKDWIHRVTL